MRDTKEEDTEEKARWRWRQTLEFAATGMPGTEEAGRSREGFSLRAFRGSMALPTP